MKPTAKIKIQHSVLLDALKIASNTTLTAVKCLRNEYPPIFCCAVFKPRRTTIDVMSSDYHSFTSVPVSTLSRKGHPGKFAIMIEDLLPVMNKLDDQELTIDVFEHQATFHHAFGRFTLPLVTEGLDFFFERRGLMKQRQVNHTLELEASYFRSALNRLCKYAALDELRPVFGAVFIKRQAGKIDFCASDGHRLMLISKPDQECTLMSSLIIPLNIVSTLRRTLPRTGSVTLEYSEWKEDDSSTPFCRLFMEDDGSSLWFAPLSGKYPDFTKVIPESSPYEVIILKSEFKSSLDRMRLFTNCHEIILAKVNKGTMHLFGCDKDFEFEASEKILCEQNGNPFRLGIRISNMLMILSSIQAKNIRLQAGDSSRAVIITPEEQPEDETVTTIFMPCFIDDEEDFKLPPKKEKE